MGVRERKNERIEHNGMHNEVFLYRGVYKGARALSRNILMVKIIILIEGGGAY